MSENPRVVIGSNSGEPNKVAPEFSVADLEAFLPKHVARIRKLENERAVAASRVTEAKKEAKADGIDMGLMSFVMKLSKLDAEERAEALQKLDMYATALKYW